MHRYSVSPDQRLAAAHVIPNIVRRAARDRRRNGPAEIAGAAAVNFDVGRAGSDR